MGWVFVLITALATVFFVTWWAQQRPERWWVSPMLSALLMCFSGYNAFRTMGRDSDWWMNLVVAGALAFGLVQELRRRKRPARAT